MLGDRAPFASTYIHLRFGFSSEIGAARWCR